MSDAIRVGAVSVVLAALGALTLVSATPAWAQPAAYPSKPVTIVVPYPAGGVVDIPTRLFAQDFTKRLGQQFIVDPRPGGNFMIGMRLVKNAAPDGHMLMMHTNSMTIVQSTQKNPGIDVRADYAPISLAMRGDQGVWVNASVPAKSIKELIEYVRQNPGRLNYGSSGVGGASHLPAVRVLSLAHLDIVHVPYAGGPQLMSALSTGDVHLLFWDLATLTRLNKGQLRLLATLGKERSPLYPDVPTLQEAGIDFANSFWLGFFAPAGTPQPVVAKLNGAVRDALQSPEISAYLKTQSWVPAWTTPEVTRQLIAAEVEQWAQTVRTANIPLSD